jgi:hypothetical protein
MDRAALIEKLITTLHLNVAERQCLGSAPILYAEIASAVELSLRATGWFPPSARPAEPGRPVFEGHFLQALPEGCVRLWVQRAHPISPTRLAYQAYEDFGDAEPAIRNFLSREWQSGDIDGIAISDQ